MVTVRLRVGPFEVEASGDNREEVENSLRAGVQALEPIVPLAQKVESFLRQGPDSLSKVPDLSRTGGAAAEASISMVEFLKHTHANTETDRCLSMATHLFQNGIREFTHRDILKKYDETGLPYPANVYDVLNRLVKKAHIRPSGDKEGVKCFAVTRTGLDYIDSLRAGRPGD